MAGKPFFLTGAKAVIKVNNVSVAFATDISYRVTVRHATPRVLGRFEVETVQPLSYEVSGSLSIIRYARGLRDALPDGVAPKDTSNQGSGIGSLNNGSGLTIFQAISGTGADKMAGDAFDPGKFFKSQMFDIEISQNGENLLATEQVSTFVIPEFANIFNNVDPNNIDINNFTGFPAIITTSQKIYNVPIIRLRNCRFEEMSFSMNKRSVAIMNLTFKAQYADDDTFIATKSGVGQELS